jgi:hypothetical protein
MRQTLFGQPNKRISPHPLGESIPRAATLKACRKRYFESCIPMPEQGNRIQATGGVWVFWLQGSDRNHA